MTSVLVRFFDGKLQTFPEIEIDWEGAEGSTEGEVSGAPAVYYRSEPTRFCFTAAWYEEAPEFDEGHVVAYKSKGIELIDAKSGRTLGNQSPFRGKLVSAHGGLLSFAPLNGLSRVTRKRLLELFRNQDSLTDLVESYLLIPPTSSQVKLRMKVSMGIAYNCWTTIEGSQSTFSPVAITVHGVPFAVGVSGVNELTFSVVNTGMVSTPAIEADADTSADAQIGSSDTSPSVDAMIEVIDHEGPAATIDAEMARLESELAWADQVQQNIEVPCEAVVDLSKQEAAGSTMASGEVYLLRFGSAPCGGKSWKGFIDAVLHGPQFARLINSLAVAGYECELPEKALVLVAPEQYSDVRRAVVGHELHHFNIIIASDLEYLLEEVLIHLPFQQRPKLKHGQKGRRQLLEAKLFEHGAGTEAEDNVAPQSVGPEVPWELQVDRTFLCYAPTPRDAATVVQSTTEVVAESAVHYGYCRGENPRRSTRICAE